MTHSGSHMIVQLMNSYKEPETEEKEAENDDIIEIVDKRINIVN